MKFKQIRNKVIFVKFNLIYRKCEFQVIWTTIESKLSSSVDSNNPALVCKVWKGIAQLCHWAVEKKKKKKEEEKYWANRFKRRRAAIVERIVSLFQRARLKATALCASIETQCVYRTEETGTATRAITKKPLQHTSSLQPYFIHLYISNMLYIYIDIYII